MLHKVNEIITTEDKIIGLVLNTTNRISSLSKEETLHVIGIHLDHITQMIGLKNLPSTYMANKIIESIQMNFGYYYPEEIEYAFELAIMRKFDCNLEHYQDLTLRYITDVLLAYNKYRQKIIIENQKKNMPKLPEPKKPSEEELKADEINLITDVFNFVVNNGFPLQDYRYSFIYKLCIKHGLFIDVFSDLESKEVKEILEKARDIVKTRQAKSDGMLVAYHIQDLFDSSVIKQGKSLYLLNYFKRLNDLKQNIKDILCQTK